MPVRERSEVEKVGMAAGGAPPAGFAALKDWPPSDAPAMRTVVNSKPLLTCIARCSLVRRPLVTYCSTTWQAPVSRMGIWYRIYRRWDVGRIDFLAPQAAVSPCCRDYFF